MKSRKMIIYSVLLLLISKAIAAKATSAEIKNFHPINVQLKWYHQFQSAGFYAAIKQGYFKEEGLDVTLLEGGPTINSVDTVMSGVAQFGIGNSSLLIDYNKGIPIIMVSAIFQHSPFIILARRDNTINSISDMENHRLMVETHAAELITYLKLAGVDLNKVKIVPHTGNVAHIDASDPRNISALTAFNSIETYTASKLGIPYQVFSPRDLDINFYADTLFTTQKFANQSPEIVMAMRNALVKGWEYATIHHDEIISYMLENYDLRAGFDRVALSYEAQVISNLLEKDIVDIGYMSALRWESIADKFIEAELLSEDYTLDGFMFKDETTTPLWAIKTIIASFFFILIGGFIAIYIFKLNHKLKTSLIELSEQGKDLELLNQQLLKLSNTDALTSLANRRHFDTFIDNELARAKRSNHPITLFLIDIDNFKQFNDLYGHQAGDDCLIKLSTALDSCANRANDLVARYGGEEFAIITSGMLMSESHDYANSICKKISDLKIPHQSSPYNIVTISIGIACYIPGRNSTVNEIIHTADVNLYQAKNNGRNRVC